MAGNPYDIDEPPWPLPEGLEEADPAARIAADMSRVKRLRELLRDRRAENRAALRVLLLKLLEVADSLDRLLAVVPDEENVAARRQWQSIRVTRKILDEALRLQDVTPLDLLGREADPMLCEIDAYEIHPELPGETVVAEIIKGYRWGDEPAPLRPAVVVISRRV